MMGNRLKAAIGGTTACRDHQSEICHPPTTDALMEFTTLTPLWFALLALPVAWVAWRKSLVDRTPAMKWLALGLRLLAVLLFLLALSRPYATTEREEMHLVHLIDISESVDAAAIATAADESEAARRELRSGDRFSLLRFANGLDRADESELRELSARAAAGTATAADRGATRLATALLGSRLAFQAGMSRRLVVYSDGVATDEGVPEALAMLEREGIDVRFRPIAPLQRPEAAMVAFEPLATVAYRGEIVRMRLRMRANQTMTARARVLHRGVAVAETPVELTANEEAVAMLDVEMTTPGESRWEAELIADDDWFTENNRLSATISVKGEPRLLVLHNDERRMRPLVRAMEQQGLVLEVRGENGIPENIGELLAFDGLVIADVPASAMSQRQMQMIRQYVSDFGGGVAMLGSENSFGLGGYYQTPVEEVLPLTSRYEQEKQKATIAIALVIDKSGSMGGQPIALARASAKAVAEVLGPQDQIAVIGFDSNAQVILPMTSAADRGAVFNAIDMLEAGGGTDAYPGMERGHQMLRESVAKVKHMIVLSDGQTPPRDYPGLVGTMRAEGITISTVALGQQAATELMQQIARDGGGRHYETNDPATMPQIFTNETMQASRSAIKEDLYTSIVVGDHPVLAGYEDADLPFVLGYVMTRPKPTPTSCSSPKAATRCSPSAASASAPASPSPPISPRNGAATGSIGARPGLLGAGFPRHRPQRPIRRPHRHHQRRGRILAHPHRPQRWCRPPDRPGRLGHPRRR